MRRVSAVVLPALMCGVVVAGPAPAHANATGCSLSDPATSTNCLHVESEGGSGSHITYVRVSRLKGDADTGVATICDYRMEVMVRTRNGVLIDHLVGPQSGGCVVSAAAQDFYPDAWYPDGAQICGYVYERGTLTPGHPCAQVIDTSPPCGTPPVRMSALDPTLCPILASVAGTYGCGVITINAQGDVFVAGEPFWDCPPYDLSAPAADGGRAPDRS